VVEPIVAVLALVVAVLAAVTVFSRNPISSAFSLVIMMVALAAIYGVSGAHFISALQAIVYAGAIMVLFVFSIMLLNMNDEASEIKWSLVTAMATTLAILLFIGLGWAFFQWQGVEARPLGGSLDLQAIRDVGGNVIAVSGRLFSGAYIQFEFISLLLLVAITSALVLAKRKVD
jgi:NADH-quinone oxidoreductase subunit J